jgi:hypothetical protein
MDRPVRLEEERQAGIVAGEEVDAALEVSQLIGDRSDEVLGDHSAVLRRDLTDRELSELIEGVDDDLAAGHVVLVERSHLLEVRHRGGVQRAVVGEPAEEVRGEQRPRCLVERAECSGEVAYGVNTNCSARSDKGRRQSCSSTSQNGSRVPV